MSRPKATKAARHMCTYGRRSPPLGVTAGRATSLIVGFGTTLLLLFPAVEEQTAERLPWMGRTDVEACSRNASS